MVFLCIALGVSTTFLIDSYIRGGMIELHGMLTDPFTSNAIIQIAVAYIGTVSFAVLAAGRLVPALVPEALQAEGWIPVQV